jgi:sulfatase maturation enzyme AslB (radical SAM superfamily)
MPNDYFCVLPFFNREISRTRTTNLWKEKNCCLLPYNHNINEVRKDISNGVRSHWCQKCWTLEDAGIESDRQIKNKSYDFFADQNISDVEQEAINGNYSTRMLKLTTTNLCNATCVTCDSGSSSAWASLDKTPNYIKLDTTIYDTIDWGNIVFLNFLGGEPFYEAETWYVLEKLLSANNTDCFISITTNGSIVPKGTKLDILKLFKKLSINFSIDGIGSIFEYMRYPLSWSKTLENIDSFRNFTYNSSVSYTVSNLNVIYMKETLDWFKQMNLPNNINVVSHPRYFAPSAFPKEIKLLYPNNTFIQNHKPDDDLQFYQMLAEVKRQDTLKGIDIKNYMPKVYNLIKSYYTVRNCHV